MSYETNTTYRLGSRQDPAWTASINSMLQLTQRHLKGFFLNHHR